MGYQHIQSHRELDVYKMAFEGAMTVFELSKTFPRDEVYSLTNQFRRSSRSVCANLAEAYRKRKYEKAFVAKLSDAEGEAAETINWIDFAKACGYINQKEYESLCETYNHIIGKLVNMARHPDKWSF